MKKYLAAAVLLFCVFVSCKKNNSTNNNNNNNGDSCSITKAHIQGSYKITDEYVTSTYFTGDIFTSTNPLVTQFFPKCTQDDIISLDTTNSVYTYTDAGATCTPNGTKTGTWDLKGDTIIRVTGTTNDSLVINSYDCKTAIVTYSQTLGTVKLTLTKQ